MITVLEIVLKIVAVVALAACLHFYLWKIAQLVRLQKLLRQRADKPSVTAITGINCGWRCPVHDDRLVVSIDMEKNEYSCAGADVGDTHPLPPCWYSVDAHGLHVHGEEA